MLSAILWIMLFALSLLNGYFVYSHYLVILADIVLVFAYTGIFMPSEAPGVPATLSYGEHHQHFVMQKLAVLNLQPAG